MSYCVNCGVELDASAASCPLCGTPVVNPNELMKKEEAQIPFPAKKGQVEAVKPKDLGVLLTMLVLAAAALCGALNAFVFRDSMWALTVAGACALLWVILEPFVICTRQPVYLSLFLDGAAVVFLMYMITFLTRDMGWFLHLGIPLAVLVTAICLTGGGGGVRFLHFEAAEIFSDGPSVLLYGGGTAVRRDRDFGGQICEWRRGSEMVGGGGDGVRYSGYRFRHDAVAKATAQCDQAQASLLECLQEMI